MTKENLSATDKGLVDTVPPEVYLAYDDRAKAIAARAATEAPVAIKNAILRFVLEARLSATPYVSEAQVAKEAKFVVAGGAKRVEGHYSNVPDIDTRALEAAQHLYEIFLNDTLKGGDTQRLASVQLFIADIIRETEAERDEARQSWREAVEMYQVEVARVEPLLNLLRLQAEALKRPIPGIENRTPQEVFDMMCARAARPESTS